MRLVKDGKIYLDGTLREYEKEKLAFEKLEKIEDIEEELGVDLLTLFKALNECYVDGHKGTAIIINHKEIGIKYQINDYNWTSKICKIKDYGKTWTLTKEELK